MPEEKKEMSQKELGKLAIEIWKLEKRLKKIEKLDEEEKKATNFLLNRINKIIEGYNVKIVEYTGQKFLEGMTGIDILSAETDKKLEFPIIGETVTPAIEINGITIQRAKVVIKTPETVVDENQNKEENKTIEGDNNSSKINVFILIGVVLLVGLIGFIYLIRFPYKLDNNNGQSNKTENILLKAGDNLTEAGDNLTEAGDNLTETGDNLTETGDNLTETGDITIQVQTSQPSAITGNIKDINQNELSGNDTSSNSIESGELLNN